jgi:hypothetical protein
LILFQLQPGSINDVDSFDTDRLSGSIRYDDDIPQPVMDYEIIRKDDKKTKKKDVKKFSSISFIVIILI